MPKPAKLKSGSATSRCGPAGEENLKIDFIGALSVDHRGGGNNFTARCKFFFQPGKLFIEAGDIETGGNDIEVVPLL